MLSIHSAAGSKWALAGNVPDTDTVMLPTGFGPDVPEVALVGTCVVEVKSETDRPEGVVALSSANTAGQSTEVLFT